jgi:hypothetical protein
MSYLQAGLIETHKVNLKYAVEATHSMRAQEVKPM